MEEVAARHGEMEAAQIVVDEIESLERRVRAFSEFAAEPPVHPAPCSGCCCHMPQRILIVDDEENIARSG